MFFATTCHLHLAQYTPLNMADSMESAGSSTVSGPKEVTEVLKNFKDLGKLGLQNVVQYNAATMPFPVCFICLFVCLFVLFPFQRIQCNLL